MLVSALLCVLIAVTASSAVAQLRLSGQRIVSSDEAPATGSYDPPAVAMARDDGADRSLIVYASTASDSDDREHSLRARLIDDEGRPVGPVRTVADPAFAYSSEEPAKVVFNPRSGEYLVSWLEQSRIVAQRLDADGRPEGPKLTVGEHAQRRIDAEKGPGLAVSPLAGEYLVAWVEAVEDHDGYEVGSRVVARRLDGDARPIGDEQELTSSASYGLDDHAPAATYHPGTDEYLVAWGDGRVYGRRVPRRPEEPLSAPFPISDRRDPLDRREANGTGPAVAVSPETGEYLVAWRGGDPGLIESRQEVLGQRLDASGAQLGEDDFVITDSRHAGDRGTGVSGPVQLVHDGESGEFLALWRDPRSGPFYDALPEESTLYGARMDERRPEAAQADVRISEPEIRPRQDSHPAGAAVTSVGGEYVGAWFDVEWDAEDGDGAFDKEVVTRLLRPGHVDFDTRIGEIPPPTDTDGDATFTFASPGAVDHFECRLDRRVWSECDSPHRLTGLTDAPRSLEVRAVDDGGWVEPTQASHEWTVEGREPQTEIVERPPPVETTVLNHTGRLRFRGSEPGTLECRLNDEAWETCSYSPATEVQTYSRTLSGTRTRVEIRLRDRTGRVESTPEVVEWEHRQVAGLETTLEGGPDRPNSRAATFEFSSNARGAEFDCWFSDRPEWRPCTSPVSRRFEGGDSAGFEVRARDVSGWVDPTPASRSWKVDEMPPVTRIDRAPPVVSAADHADFGLTSEYFNPDKDGQGYVECRLDGGAWTRCEQATGGWWTAAYDALSQGVHVFEARSVDQAGNVEATPVRHAWTVDTRRSGISVDGRPTVVTPRDTSTFRWMHPDAGATFECRLDGAGWERCASPHSVGPLGDGAHRLAIRAVPPGGAPEAATEVSWTVDTTAPTTAIVWLEPDGSESLSSRTFYFGPSEHALTECRVDDGSWRQCDLRSTFNGLSDGEHTIEARSLDAVGNREDPPASRTFRVESTAPRTYWGGPVPEDTSSTARFTFRSDQPDARFECSMDGAAWSGCSSPAAFDGLSEGEHELRVRAVGAGGLVDATPLVAEFDVDTTPPRVTLSRELPDIVDEDAGYVYLTANGTSLSRYECRMDGGAWNRCSTSFRYEGLADGPHLFEARGVDSVGNTSATVSHSFTVDTDPPGTTITRAPEGRQFSDTAELAWDSDEAGTRSECLTDTSNDHFWAGCSSPRTLRGLEDGEHRVAVRAVDRAGNVGATTPPRTWTVNAEPPSSYISSGPEARTTSTRAVLRFSASSEYPALGHVECRLDGGPWERCSASRTYEGLADGDHAFEVRGVDEDGVADPTPAVRRWAVNPRDPGTKINAGPPSRIHATDATFGLESTLPDSTFECRLDGSDWAPCSSTPSFADLSEGPHVLLARAVSADGVLDPTPEGRQWTVDRRPPDTQVDTHISSGMTVENEYGDFQMVPVGLAAGEDADFRCKLDGVSVPCAFWPRFRPGPLENGEHEVEMAAVDAAGNVDPTPVTIRWTVAIDRPETVIDSTPPDLLETPDAEYTFRSSIEGAEFECQWGPDWASWKRCSSPHRRSDVPEGDRRFAVRASYRGHRDPSPAVHEFRADGPPATTISKPPPAATRELSTKLEFHSGDHPSSYSTDTFECRVDGLLWVACRSPHTISATTDPSTLLDGEHTVEVRATDRTGHVEQSPALARWTVDRASPDTTIASGPSGVRPERTSTFEFTSSEAGATFECRGGRSSSSEWHACVSPLRFEDFPDGSYSFEVRAKDPAGNVDPIPERRAWSVDGTPANTTIRPVAGGFNGGTSSRTTQSFELSADAPTTDMECRLDDAPWRRCARLETFAGLSDDLHVLRARATDTLGRVDASPASWSFTVDTHAPDTEMLSGPSGVTREREARLAFSATEQSRGQWFECRLDDGQWSTCTSPRRLTDLSGGHHRFEVRGVDAAENRDPTPAVQRWEVDAPPDTSIRSRPAETTTSRDASVAFAADRSDASFECRLDGADWTSCASPAEYSRLAPGAHAFEVRAVAPNGERDPSPARATWTVERTRGVTITEAPPSLTRDRRADFGFEAVWNYDHFECRVDGGDWERCDSPEPVEVGEGEHRFEVRGVEAPGEPDGVTAAHEWTVDDTPPESEITAAPRSGSAANDAIVEFRASEPGTASVCRLDRGAWEHCASPRSVTVAAGQHIFEVRSADTAGNVEPEPASAAWTVAPRPASRVTAGPSGVVRSTRAEFSFGSDRPASGYQCRIDGASGNAWAPCSSPAAFTVGDGLHLFEVRAIDDTGRPEDTGSTRAWTVDTQAPETGISSAPPARTTQRSARFAFGASEAGAGFECRLDGGAWSLCASPRSVDGLAVGAHRFEVRALDAAGNADQSPASAPWIVDPMRFTVGSARALGDQLVITGTAAVPVRGSISYQSGGATRTLTRWSTPVNGHYRLALPRPAALARARSVPVVVSHAGESRRVVVSRPTGG